MEATKYDEIAIDTKSWMATTWEKIADLFGNNEVVTDKSVCEQQECSIDKRLETEARTVYHHAFDQVLPKVGAYQQTLLDTVIQASTVYSPEEAQEIFDEGNKRIEAMKGHVQAIRINARKLRESQFGRQPEIEKSVICGVQTLKQYIDTVRFHINQLESMLQLS